MDRNEHIGQATFGLKEASATLAEELGPGDLTLTHPQHHEGDSSEAAFATTATALAFVLRRSEKEIRDTPESLLRLPCQFEMEVKQVGRLPESLQQRTGFTRNPSDFAALEGLVDVIAI